MRSTTARGPRRSGGPSLVQLGSCHGAGGRYMAGSPDPGPSWWPWVVLLYPVVWCLAWGDQELAPAPHLLLEQGQGVVRGPGAT